MKTYRPYQPRQGFLLPPSPLDWLPEDHLASVLLETVSQLDLSAISAYSERETRGFPPHDPRMMLALLLYAYCVGVPSSRKIEQRTHEDIAFRILAANTHPDHSCISEFRRMHLDAVSALFVQVLKLCERMGLVKLGTVALDGTKLKANASKHKAMSLARMNQETEQLEKKVRELLAAAEQADAIEDAQYGKRHRSDKLPEDLRRAQSRLAKIRAAQAELEAEAAAQAQEKQEAASEDAQAEAVLDEMARIKDAQHLASSDRCADWQARHCLRRTARRRDPAQTLDEQAYAAAIAVRWRLVDHPHVRLTDKPTWRVLGCLLDERSEAYLRTLTQERIDEMMCHVGGASSASFLGS